MHLNSLGRDEVQVEAGQIGLFTSSFCEENSQIGPQSIQLTPRQILAKRKENNYFLK
jgi:hypothetical protein